MQFGPSNLLWESPTRLKATMIGFPHDDLDGWRGVYPPDVFIAQLDKVADGFERAAATLLDPTLKNERSVAEAAAIHFHSTANQARFVAERRALEKSNKAEEARPVLERLERILKEEEGLAKRLHGVQSSDSRIGFEASNHYYYVPIDLAEKILNCRDLLDRWLPAQKARW